MEREFSVDVPIKAKAAAGRGLYRLTDNFFRFWYTFVYANYSQLEDGDVDGIYEYVIKPDLHEFAAYTFEDVCREFLKECQKRRALPFRHSEYHDVLAKHEALKKDGVFYYALFSESGFDQKIMENAEKSENIMLYPLEEIVEDPL